MDLGIRGKRAIVCASSKGLGLACARSLAREGVDLVMLARGREVLPITVANQGLSLKVTGPAQKEIAWNSAQKIALSARMAGATKIVFTCNGQELGVISAAEGEVRIDPRQLGQGPVKIYAVATADGKASIVVGVTEDITARVSAVDLVRVAAEALGGKGGGGRPDMAQAGGPDADKAPAALAAIEKRLGELTPV